MKQIIKILNIILPFNNIFKNILFYLCLSPIFNFILTNIYYYNCGGYIKGFNDLLNVINPFTTSNPLCVLLVTLISGNLYLIQYIYIFMFILLISLFIHY